MSFRSPVAHLPSLPSANISRPFGSSPPVVSPPGLRLRQGVIPEWEEVPLATPEEGPLPKEIPENFNEWQAAKLFIEAKRRLEGKFYAFEESPEFTPRLYKLFLDGRIALEHSCKSDFFTPENYYIIEEALEIDVAYYYMVSWLDQYYGTVIYKETHPYPKEIPENYSFDEAFKLYERLRDEVKIKLDLLVDEIAPATDLGALFKMGYYLSTIACKVANIPVGTILKLDDKEWDIYNTYSLITDWLRRYSRLTAE